MQKNQRALSQNVFRILRLLLLPGLVIALFGLLDLAKLLYSTATGCCGMHSQQHWFYDISQNGFLALHALLLILALLASLAQFRALIVGQARLITVGILLFGLLLLANLVLEMYLESIYIGYEKG